MLDDTGSYTKLNSEMLLEWLGQNWIGSPCHVYVMRYVLLERCVNVNLLRVVLSFTREGSMSLGARIRVQTELTTFGPFTSQSDDARASRICQRSSQQGT